MMDTQTHNLSTLFAQLGLPEDPAGIDSFIREHPLPPDMLVADAPFWNQTQAKFLRDALREDSDWAEMVDELNVRVH